MSWSFRISTLNKNRTPIMQLPHPHLEIPKWLDVLDLRQYEGKCAEKKKTNKNIKIKCIRLKWKHATCRELFKVHGRRRAYLLQRS